MPLVDVNFSFYSGIFGINGNGNPLNGGRNGIGPPGSWARFIGDHANFINAARTKTLGSKNIRASQAITSTADNITWRWAFHTGPVTKHVGATFVCAPNDGANTNNPSYLYLTVDSTLTGVDPTTDKGHYAVNVSKTGTINPDDLIVIHHTPFTVSADTDYRAALHVVNGVRVISATLYEIPRLFLDTSTDTNAVDVTKFGYGQFIHDAPQLDLITATDKIWKRGGPVLFAWNVNGTTAVTRTTATAANVLDQSLTAWGANNPGFPVTVANHHSLDSANVGVVCWAAAKVSAGSGKVEFMRNGATVASITISATTTTFASAASTMPGTNASENIQVLITGPGGADTLSVYACGMFCYVS